MNVQMGNERIEKGGMTLVAYVESKRSRFEPTILRQSIRKVLLFLFSITNSAMFILTCMCQINFSFRACSRMITHTHLIKRITCIIVTYMLFHANKHCLNFEWLFAHGYSMSFQQLASTTTSEKWLIFFHTLLFVTFHGERKNISSAHLFFVFFIIY